MKLFISGMRNKENLDNILIEKINDYVEQGYEILLPDKDGIAESVQQMIENRYDKVTV